MAEIDLMSATESVVSCSPTITLISEGDAPAVQWAAVSTWRVESSEPPHQGLLPVLDTRPTLWSKHLKSIMKNLSHLTCHGYSLTSVSTPPTILVVVRASPQLHVEPVPVPVPVLSIFMLLCIT